ncbi:1-deoxy-D-xylulose-5-phosphate synthase [Mycobacterium sp. 852002-40037_SCH5390672]|uniref:1-deoxy-D-xylulose-5-phosphate synthase n=1 Tax=Mycobacterium sp. 852002-40037_SCH5390672 TaxID=1834089 RepID=UPI000804CFF7|nr:1-deoxy-D-xylulose-5-phosphate synthase [Mycobacterium sp. 852002-40037_SCH5390672]OBB96779.1 1-deoxy-D-xylulose-5-phosphate synthase [Mycobacterium sp. 852002-40037_SCH5390672]
MTTLLNRINDPCDLQGLTTHDLACLAAEIRAFLIEKVSVTGGHLGPNLGVVELTIALHRAFRSPHDAILFDTGHQSYTHKILTGRRDRFDHLRTASGLSGYPSRAESCHDWIESSHASAALSYADGLAKAFTLSNMSDRHVAVVVGDGALTGGMCWEALNNIATNCHHPIVIVVNDNGRSYAPTIGGVAQRLSRLRTKPGWDRALRAIKRELSEFPVLGRPLYALLHAIKAALKDALAPQALFSDLGIKYLGPIDGHDIAALERALQQAKSFGGPVIVHAVTVKGMGFGPAETDPADRMHSCGPIDPLTGTPRTAAAATQWTDIFAAELLHWGEQRPDIVGLTAAMPGPTGLAEFGAKYPDRMFDVGIAEQHAVTCAAGLALGGLHPVVAIYSTFLNRAFDQVMMDVALLGLPVTLVLDRAGITGSDGASHNGMWDLSILGVVPGMRVSAPRDGHALREQLAEALAIQDGPTAIRFPKGPVGADIDALERIEGVDILYHQPAPDILLVAVGTMAAISVEVATALHRRGTNAVVVDPRWVQPVPDQVVKFASDVHLVVTVEESGLHGGVGSAVASRMRDAQIDTPVRNIGVPQCFLQQGSRAQIHSELGLSTADILARIDAWTAHS